MNDNCWWWLRTPGNKPYYAAVVNHFGAVRDTGYDKLDIYDPLNVNYDKYAVRPALWVKLK